MVSFEQAVSKLLCGIQDELKKIRQINETWEKRETTDIAFFTIPENGGVRSFAIGTTKIDFRTGVIVNPDGTNEYMNRKLDMISQEWLHSISVDSNQDLKLKILPNSIRSVDAYFSTQIPYLNYNEIEITCTAATNIKIFACTNPSAVVGQYKNPMTDVDGRIVVSSISQLNVEKDAVEAQTWDDTLTSLMSNLNRIRYGIVQMSGEAWGTFSHSIATIWGKFNATTGHTHSGAADQGAQIDHVNLANIGTNTHAQIDTTLGSLAATYAPIAKGVTNGDSHDHNGGDDAQIDHVNLANIGTNTHAQIDAHIAAASGSSGFFRQFWQGQGIVVSGTWSWAAGAGQTDYSSVRGEGAGFWNNSSHLNLDEYKWSSIFLTVGTYKITMIYQIGSDSPIVELLFGTTSIGTIDEYSAPTAFNQSVTFTFTVTTPTTADLRFRVNGKNASSSNYYARFSRLQLEKTG
jgi:hypothetical protein